VWTKSVYFVGTRFGVTAGARDIVSVPSDTGSVGAVSLAVERSIADSFSYRYRSSGTDSRKWFERSIVDQENAPSLGQRPFA
jgi:hypothetical protein